MEPMLERVITAMRVSWDKDAVTAARAVVDAVLSDVDTDGGYCRWERGDWVVVAYPAGSRGSEVELFVAGVETGLSAVEAETRGLMLLAAARRSRELTRSDVEVA
jgi:hypothetical protein